MTTWIAWTLRHAPCGTRLEFERPCRPRPIVLHCPTCRRAVPDSEIHDDADVTPSDAQAAADAWTRRHQLKGRR